MTISHGCQHVRFWDVSFFQGVMTCGGIEFKTKGRDDQAECEDVSGFCRQIIFKRISQSQVSPTSFPGKAFGAFLIDPFNTIKAFCKPRIKVGTEWVTKGEEIDF